MPSENFPGPADASPGERNDLEFVADNPGTWVFHCHILSHVANKGVEPGGMLTVLKVSWSKATGSPAGAACPPLAPLGARPAPR